MKLKKFFVCVLPIVIVALVYILAIVYANFIDSKFLPCWFNLLTGYQCAGCGGTRSFYALLHGDIISSIEYNAFVPFMAVVGIVLYIRLFLKVIVGKNITVLPTDDRWVYIPLVGFLIYFVARNFIN